MSAPKIVGGCLSECVSDRGEREGIRVRGTGFMGGVMAFCSFPLAQQTKVGWLGRGRN